MPKTTRRMTAKLLDSWNIYTRVLSCIVRIIDVHEQMHSKRSATTQNMCLNLAPRLVTFWAPIDLHAQSIYIHQQYNQHPTNRQVSFRSTLQSASSIGNTLWIMFVPSNSHTFFGFFPVDHRAAFTMPVTGTTSAALTALAMHCESVCLKMFGIPRV